MKIGFLNATYSEGSTSGGSAHVRQFVDNAIDLGHEVWSNGAITRKGCQIFSSRRIQRIREQRSLDCFYHRIEGNVPPSVCSWDSTYKRSLVPVPHVWEWNTVPDISLLSGMSTTELESLRYRWRSLAKGCSLSVCVSQSIADYLTELGFRRCVVVPNGSDPSLFHCDIQPCGRMANFEGRFNIVWIGSGEVGWHDFETIQKVASKIQIEFGDAAQFHLIGTGMRDLHDTPSNVHYHGNVSYEMLPTWLAGADAGIVAYKKGAGLYSSPLKLFDYMASGLSVISTEQPQTRQILESVNLGSNVVGTGCVSGLVDLVRDFLTDSDLAKSQGETLRRLFLRKFTWKKNVETVFDELAQLAL